MQASLRDTRTSLIKTIALSIILHAAFISFGALAFKSAKKTFLSPVYTVTLVDPSSLRAGPSGGTRERAEAAKTPAKPSVQEKEAQAPRPAVKTASKALTAGKEKEPAVSEAIKKITEKVKRKEETESLQARIEEIRRKEASGSKEMRSRLEGIRKEIGRKSETGEKAGAEMLGTYVPQTAGGGGGGGGAGGRGGGGYTGELSAKQLLYLSQIRDMVQDKWAFPQEPGNHGISVIVSIRIGRNGKLLDLWLEKSSGSSAFDESLMNAVKKAAPFPPLPVDFRGDYLDTGLRFCPGCSD